MEVRSRLIAYRNMDWNVGEGNVRFGSWPCKNRLRGTRIVGVDLVSQASIAALLDPALVATKSLSVRQLIRKDVFPYQSAN